MFLGLDVWELLLYKKKMYYIFTMSIILLSENEHKHRGSHYTDMNVYTSNPAHLKQSVQQIYYTKMQVWALLFHS